MRRNLKRIRRPRFERGKERNEGAVEGFRKERLEVHARLSALLKQCLECGKRDPQAALCVARMPG